MTHKHAIFIGLVVGGVLGYYFADKLVAYQPYKYVAEKVTGM